MGAVLSGLQISEYYLVGGQYANAVPVIGRPCRAGARCVFLSVAQVARIVRMQPRMHTPHFAFPVRTPYGGSPFRHTSRAVA